MAEQPVFYFDLGSPECYLVAERVMSAAHAVPEWEPVPAAEFAAEAEIDRAAIEEIDRAAIELRAAELGLQPLRWPERWPPDSRTAMLAATYAKQIGRGVAFSLAAFRQAFAAGRDLGDENTILIAGAACEMHPAALLKGIGLRSTSEAMARALERARKDGVQALPALIGAAVSPA